MPRRPTEGSPEDTHLATMCSNARRVVEFCELLGYLGPRDEPIDVDGHHHVFHHHHGPADGAWILPEEV